MAMTREQLLQAFGALANTQALRRQEEQKKVAPQVLKPVVKPVWNESKVPVTPQLQQRNLDIAKKVVSTTPGAFAYGVGRGISMPVTSAAKLMGYQESPEEAAVRTLAESKRLTAQMDTSKGMGQPNIIQGRSIAPEMVGRVAGSILPFSKAEAAAGALFPQIAGAGIKNTALRGAVSGGALQGLEEAGQGKRGMELAGSVALGTALGAGADIGLGYLGKAIRNIKAGQKVSEAVADIAQKAPESRVTIQQELGLPEGSTWADIQRKLDEEDAVEALYQKYENTKAPVQPQIPQRQAIAPEFPKTTAQANVTPSIGTPVVKPKENRTMYELQRDLGMLETSERVTPNKPLYEGVNLNESDIKNGTVKNIKYSKSLENEARYSGGKITVGDKFFSLDEGGRKAVISHEIAHGIVDDLPKEQTSVMFDVFNSIFKDRTKYEKVIGNAAWNKNGQEVATDLISWRIDNPDELKQMYPEAYELADALLNAKDIKQTSLVKNIKQIPQIEKSELEQQIEMWEDIKSANPKRWEETGSEAKLVELKNKLSGERATPEPSIKLDKQGSGAGIKPEIPQTQPVTQTLNKIAPQVNTAPVAPKLSALNVDNGPSLTVPVPKTKVEPQVTTTATRTPERQAAIEAITEPGMKERGFSENLGTDLNRPQQTIDSFNDDPEFYTVLSNKTKLDKAQSILDKGYESALKSYDEIGRTFEAHKVPLGIKLSDEAVARGDFDTSRRILADLAEELTSAGQFSQAANILRRSKDPEAATLFLQRQINKLNKDGSEQYGKKWAPVGLTDEELQAVTSATGDQAKYDAAMESIYTRIAKQIPSSNREKFDAWRRMAMLLNPKTHVRNIVGNTLMKGLERTSDFIAQILESAVRPAERTRAIGWSSDKGLVKTVQDSWEAVKPDLTHMSKYEISGLKAFNREKPIFKTKAIEFMNNLSKSTLEAEDVFFMKSAYQDALGQYMKANKLTVPNANAIEYAKNRAMEATFRSANALATFIENVKRKKGIPGVLAEAAIPFSKTPANILMRGIDYSPFGLVKLLASKDKTPAEIIDVIAKGATGSSLVGLGMMLADNGWARGDYTTAKKEGLAELTGEQPMSIITPQGSYTFDWAQPGATPLAMGIAIQENLKKKNPDAAKIVIDAIAAGGDSIINMSMLQNLKDLMGGGFESPSLNVASLPKQYIEQAFPSFVGQIARISDPKQRISYADTELQKAINQLKAKIPGARQTLEPKIDVLGREVQAGGPVMRVVQNLISPGSIKVKSNEPVVTELSRLYESGRDTRIIPRLAPKTLERTVDGKKEELKLTSQQLTTFQKSMGRNNADELKTLFASDDYKNADDTEKAKKVSKIVEDNYDEEKEKAFEQGNYY